MRLYQKCGRRWWNRRPSSSSTVRHDGQVRLAGGQPHPLERRQYEALLKEEIFTGIQGRRIRGFKNIQLLRRVVGEEVEFVTIMLFDSLEAVREFAGEDYEAAVVPAKRRAVLSHFDGRSQHYEVREERQAEV